jgi:hypothetical protein
VHDVATSPLIIAGLLGAFLSGCDQPAPQARSPVPPPAAIVRDTAAPPGGELAAQLTDPCAGRDWPTCAPSAESIAVAATAGRIERSGTNLRVRIPGRADLRLQDDPTEGERYVRHRYLGVFPGLPYDIVERSYYEGGAYLAIHHATGDTTVLDDLPLIAPGGARLFVASADLEAGYAPNRLTIYRVGPAGLRVEWRQETADVENGTGWAADSARWRDSLTIEAVRLVPTRGQGPTRAGRVRISRVGGTWRVVPAPGA